MLVAAHGRRVPRSERDRLILEHRDLVRKIAVSVQRRSASFLNLDDLIDPGIQALIQAADQFEFDRGATFASYAKHRIRGAILDSTADWYQRHVEHRILEHLPAHRHGTEQTDTRAIEVRQAIARLKPRQQRIIALYYTEGRTLQDIAERLSVTRGRVCQLHSQAVAALRTILE